MQLTSNALPASLGQEWQALDRETDPELRTEAALAFAQRQSQAGRPELAVEIYRGLLAEQGLNPALADRARASLDILLGRGSFGGRAEFLMRNLAEQATDPSALFAMGAAGAVFRMTRLAALSRLATEANPGFLTRLLGAGRVASLLGFAVEAPTFTVAGRLGAAVLGREQDWSLPALRRDLASSYMVLGGLKLAGALGQGAATRLGSSPALRGLTQQGSMLGGILLGRRLEEWTGLRERRDGATLLTDSLALLLQFHVAGRLSGSLFGEHVQAWENHLDLQAQQITENSRPQLLRPLFNAPGEGFNVPVVLMSQSGNGENGDGTPPRGRPTLPGIGRESRPPAPTPPRRVSIAAEVPLYSEAPPFRLEGLAPGTRLIRVPTALPRTQDPMAWILENLNQYFHRYTDSVVLQYDGHINLDNNLLSMFKIDLYSLYRERALPPETRVSLLFSQEREVAHYRRQKIGFQLDRESMASVAAVPVATAQSEAPTRKVSVANYPVSSTPNGSGVAEDLEGAKRGFRSVLAGLEASGVLSPAIRLNRGRVDEDSLQDFAAILSEHPLPEGRKISIFWVEAGGGRVTFQRTGDRVLVERKGYLKDTEVFFLLPMDSFLGHLRVFPANAFPPYKFEDYRNYERSLEQETALLADRMAFPKQQLQLIARDEGGAQRGERLSKLSLHWLQQNGQRGRTLTSSAQEDFVSLHRLLERSQAYLDLGTLQRFRERLRLVKLGEYDGHLERMNLARQTAGLPRMIPLRELGAALPMEYVVPMTDVLRAAFCEQLFKARGGWRIPLENNLLLRDPHRAGEILREMIRSRALPLLASIKMVEVEGAGETPQSLLAQKPEDLSERAQSLRKNLEFFLEDWIDFTRILSSSGRGATHRLLLSEVFEGSRSISDLYRQVLLKFNAFPPEIQRKYRLDQVPAWRDLNAALRGSRP